MPRSTANPASGSATTYRFALVRTDVRSLVGSVLMGVLMVLIVGLGDRIDASLTGGAFPIFGGIAWATTMALSVMLFGLPGAFIAGEIQAIMDLAFGVPLAPAFFFANGLGPVVFALISHRLSMQSRLHYLWALIPSVVVGNACVAAYLIVIFDLPRVAITLSTAGVVVVSVSVSALTVRPLVRAIYRSRILGR